MKSLFVIQLRRLPEQILIDFQSGTDMSFLKSAQPALKVGIAGPIPFTREEFFSVILGAVYLALREDKLPRAKLLRLIQLLVHY